MCIYSCVCCVKVWLFTYRAFALEEHATWQHFRGGSPGVVPQEVVIQSGGTLALLRHHSQILDGVWQIVCVAKGTLVMPLGLAVSAQCPRGPDRREENVEEGR